MAKLYAPITVPFLQDQCINFDAYISNLKKICSTSLDGIVLPGSNSESPFLTSDEKIELWEKSVPLLAESGKELIAGSGVETTAETIALTLKAAEVGAGKALILPPHFFKSKLKPSILVEHFYAAADSSPIPLWVYNMPLYMGYDLGIDLLRELADHPNIVGIKDSGNNVIKMGQLLSSHLEFEVYAGSGGSFLPFLSIGAAGVVAALANIKPEALRKLANAFEAGRLGEARSLQIALADLNAGVTARYGIPGLKFCLDELGMIGGECRKPLQAVGIDEKQHLQDILRTLEKLQL